MAHRRSGYTNKTTKGYPRITAGPLRNQYLHRVVAAAMIGRDLRKDEEVHHRDSDKMNFHFSNLIVLGEADHNWCSTKQAWFMRNRDREEKKHWDAFMAEEEKAQKAEIAESKLEGEGWSYEDGGIDIRYEQFRQSGGGSARGV